MFKKQIIDFYHKNKQLDPNAQGCCKNINESYQKARENHDEGVQL